MKWRNGKYTYPGLPFTRLSWQRIHLQCWIPGFNPCVGKIPWKRKTLPTPVFWSGEFHGLYSPWDCKESEDFPGGSAVKNLLANARPQEMPVPSLGQEDPLEKEMAIQSSILAWKIPWTQEPGGLQSICSQGVRCD